MKAVRDLFRPTVQQTGPLGLKDNRSYGRRDLPILTVQVAAGCQAVPMTAAGTVVRLTRAVATSSIGAMTQERMVITATTTEAA